MTSSTLITFRWHKICMKTSMLNLNLQGLFEAITKKRVEICEKVYEYYEKNYSRYFIEKFIEGLGFVR